MQCLDKHCEWSCASKYEKEPYLNPWQLSIDIKLIYLRSEPLKVLELTSRWCHQKILFAVHQLDHCSSTPEIDDENLWTGGAVSYNSRNSLALSPS